MASFTKYIKNKFYNQLFDISAKFIVDNKVDLGLYSDYTNRSEEVELHDFEIKYVYASASNSNTGMLDFDVLVNCYVLVKSANNHHDEEDSRNRWLRIECSGVLDAGIKNFKIENVSQYEKGSYNKFKFPMSDELVPLVWKKDLDKVASSFLKFYYPQALEFPQAINPSALIQKMGLELEKRKLTDDVSIFGQIYFHDVPEKSVKAGTILIESELENIRYKGTINNTIIHECVHWSMHRKAFELERVLQKELTHLSTISSLESSKSKASATDWMEWQTESLTPKIMMPKEMFKQESQLIIKNLIEKSVSKDSLEIIESVIDELAVYFGVSRLSAKIRLVELGLDIAIGAFNYIDGKYVPTHYWSKGFLESNQTFSISLIDAGLQLLSNSELKRNVDNGALVFVEFHYCLNDSKYVSYDIFGKPFLTPYARHHMDECCIVFDISIKVHSGNQTLAHTLVLNRDKDSDIKYTIGYPKNKNISVQEKANYLMEQATDIQEGLKNITDDFGSALSYLIKWRETTNEALASDSRLSVERISRLRNNKVDKPKLKTVIALCVGLGLPPIFSFKLLETAGYTLRLVNPDERMYQMILSGCSSLTISECNELLVASGCKTLVDE